MIFSFSWWDLSRRSLRFLANFSGSLFSISLLVFTGQWPLVKGFSYWATRNSQALGLTKKRKKNCMNIKLNLFYLSVKGIWNIFGETLCGNLRIFLPLRINVKLISRIAHRLSFSWNQFRLPNCTLISQKILVAEKLLNFYTVWKKQQSF